MYNRFKPESTKELINRAVKILDAKYEKSDVPQIVKDTCSYHKESQKLELFSLIQKYEPIFYGTLGKLENRSCTLQVKGRFQTVSRASISVP